MRVFLPMPGSVSMMSFLRAGCFLSLTPATPSISSTRPLPTPSSLTAISSATLTQTETSPPEIESLAQQKKSGQNSRRSETLQLIGCACSGVLDRSVASREFWQRLKLLCGMRKKPSRASDAQLCG